MPTTSLKLPAAAAERQGLSPHAFMVEAIRAAAMAAEKRAAFVADAVAARTEATESGKGYAAEEVHAYIEARARGKTARKPRARTWRG